MSTTDAGVTTGAGPDLAGDAGSLLYLGTGRGSVEVAAAAGSSAFLLGGEPPGKTLLMWWNFVGRTPADIVAAARDWAGGERFGQVAGYRGAPLAAPPLDEARLPRRS
jgi:redox-sensitive bicupin YhaK (pirin superfamily)